MPFSSFFLRSSLIEIRRFARRGTKEKEGLLCSILFYYSENFNIPYLLFIVNYACSTSVLHNRDLNDSGYPD